MSPTARTGHLLRRAGSEGGTVDGHPKRQGIVPRKGYALVEHDQWDIYAYALFRHDGAVSFIQQTSPGGGRTLETGWEQDTSRTQGHSLTAPSSWPSP